MKKRAGLAGAIFILVCWCSSAFAAAAASDSGAAQAYGVKGANLSQEEFTVPWRSYEEKTQKLGDGVDEAYCYTPFLVVALDAKAKIANHLPVYVQEGEQLWRDYAGFFTFAVHLYGSDAVLPTSVSVWIEQDKATLLPVQSNLPAEMKAVTLSNSPVAGVPKPRQTYLFTAYYYFSDEGINRDRPLILCVAAKEKKYRFFFDMKSIR